MRTASRGSRTLGPDEIREVEPNATGIAALHSPATGVVDFAQVAASFAARTAGARRLVVTGCAVKSLEPRGAGVEARHARGTTRARAAVLCAGAWADRLAVRAGADRPSRGSSRFAART